jgi:formate dehydrogenase iron-sulfur subunit
MSDKKNNLISTKVFIPRDSCSLSLGAEKVAQTFHRQLTENNLNESVEIIRNGSRGLYWLEPLVEIETDQGRFAFGPVKEKDVTEIINNHVLQQNQNHPLFLGPVEDIPALKNQQRLTFARAGVIDPLNIPDYKKTDGFTGLKKAIALSGQDIVETIKDSGLRGRGGAAFPTGIKWQTVLDAKADQKYIVCNADEGDSGTFADRLQMEADPFGLIEGMTIAGFAVGATKGYIYLREEYPHAHEILKSAITIAEKNNYLGENILDSDKTFHLEIRLGAKAYICGEETALLESLEGKRGMVRPKPPIPALEGLFGKPTIVNNVLTLSTVAIILAKGSSFYKNFGQGRSRGTMPFQLAGNLKHSGLFEFAFGITLKELLFDYGGGSYTGKPLKAVQVGGPLGTYLSESQWHVEMDYEELAALGGVLGHGGVVAFDDSVDMLEQARFAMEFCVEESCGKCTPCRIGSTRGVEVIDRIKSDEDKENNIELLEELCETMVEGSLCAMGGMTPFPVQSVLREFKDDVVN